MKEVKVEVIVNDPPCGRCRAVEKGAEKAASKVREDGINVSVEKLNILSKGVMGRYGALVSPALAVNGVIMTMGRVPKGEEIEKLLREAV